MLKEFLANNLRNLTAPEWMRSLSYLLVYPAYDATRIAEEESYAARMRILGYEVRSFGIPCPDGWWDFPKLDRAWQSRSNKLVRPYEGLADHLCKSDVLISAGGSMVHPDFLKQFSAYSLFLCTDDPENSHRLSQPVAPHFDHCFPLNIACLESYRRWGAKRVDWIFHALRPEYQDPQLTVQTILEGRRNLDLVMFCEAIFGLSDRAQRLKRLARVFPQAYLRGRGWPDGNASVAEVQQTYRNTKIGWNLHHSIGPCNTRMYMLPAFGVLQICDNKRNLGRILELDREVVGFDSLEECIEKTSYYLAHDRERREIAAQGFQRVTRDFTEENQWAYMLTKIEAGVLDKRGHSGQPTNTNNSPIQIKTKSRPKIIVLADRPGWAYDIEAQNLARVLAQHYEIQIRYVIDQPDLRWEDFDLLWVCFWGETWHKQFAIARERIIKQISSHRWRMDVEWGCLDPASFVQQHLADAGTICAISQELVDTVMLHRSCHLVNQGVDLTLFHPRVANTGPLRIGFAGNAHDICKGLTNIIMPACGQDFELQIANGDLRPAEMPAFYQDLDIICIASTAEGGPLPLIEAMACGCFPISTSVGIVPELIKHGHSGLIIDRDPAAFRAALHWCARNQEWVRQQGQQNAETIRTNRSWDVVSNSWQLVLDQALSEVSIRSLSNSEEQSSSVVLQSTTPTQQLHLDFNTGYSQHLTQINPATTSEGTYQAASYYYDAEVAPLLPSDHTSNCLELGSGFGHLLRWLHEQGFDSCIGVEIDAKIHAEAKKYLGEQVGQVVHADALDFLKQTKDQFDLILAFDFIEHFTLDRAQEILMLILDRLKEGGRIVLRTPNMANIFGIYSRYMDLTHRIGLTEQSLRHLLIQSGYTEVELTLPQWPEHHPLSHKLEKSRVYHEKLFDLQDRSRPICFDKNLVISACRPARMANSQ